MNLNKFVNSKAGMVVSVGAVFAVLSYVAAKKAKETVKDVGYAISPLNTDNVFAGGVDAIGASISGDKNFKLGNWIYEKLHGTAAEQEQRRAEQAFIKSIGG
jgi:hypothetical protein